jgi:hypothetical protein
VAPTRSRILGFIGLSIYRVRILEVKVYRARGLWSKLLQGIILKG